MLKTSKWDAADYMRTTEDVAAYLAVVLEEDGPSALPQALGTVARSEGMTRIAERTGLKREGLYKSLAESGNPSFVTVAKVLDACGMHLEIVANASQPVTA